jgi:hypothetical protein
MSSRQESRASGTLTVLAGAVSNIQEIFAPSQTTWEILEIAVSPYVDITLVTTPIQIQVLLGANAANAGTPYSPPWNVLGGGTMSDPGFILQAGSNIALSLANAGANPRTLAFMIRYRAQQCHEADTAIRRTLV